jgi:hypothetical protein
MLAGQLQRTAPSVFKMNSHTTNSTNKNKLYRPYDKVSHLGTFMQAAVPSPQSLAEL